MSAEKTRIETDTFGPIEVAADRYWGAQAQRSLELHESRLRRWGRLAMVVLQHPQLMSVAPFRQRLWAALMPVSQK